MSYICHQTAASSYFIDASSGPGVKPYNLLESPMTSTSPIITFIIRFAFLDQVTKVLFKWKHITQISRKIILERSFQIVATNKYSKIASFEELSEIRLIRICNLTREKTIMLFQNLSFIRFTTYVLHLGDSIMVKLKFYWNNAMTIVTLTFNTDF